MRLLPLALAAAILLAGCASRPDDTTVPSQGDGPADLAGQRGLLLVDTQTWRVQRLTDEPGLAWLSPDGKLLLWDDAGYQVLLDGATGKREVVGQGAWSRLYGNATVLRLGADEATFSEIRGGRTIHVAPLPHAPAGRWTSASADLRHLVSEKAGAAPCANQISIYANGTAAERTGCHARVADDGRILWSEGGAIRVRDVDGATRNITGGMETVGDETIAHENPVPTADGVVYLRLAGGDDVRLTNVVDETGVILATLPGPERLAIHDASDDGRLLLLRVFTS